MRWNGDGKHLDWGWVSDYRSYDYCDDLYVTSSMKPEFQRDFFRYKLESLGHTSSCNSWEEWKTLLANNHELAIQIAIDPELRDEIFELYVKYTEQKDQEMASD